MPTTLKIHTLCLVFLVFVRVGDGDGDGDILVDSNLSILPQLNAELDPQRYPTCTFYEDLHCVQSKCLPDASVVESSWSGPTRR